MSEENKRRDRALKAMSLSGVAVCLVMFTLFVLRGCQEKPADTPAQRQTNGP